MLAVGMYGGFETMRSKRKPAGMGAKLFDDFEEHRYHQPSDEYHASMDFRGDAKMARFGLILGWEASSLPEAVGWQKGDEFEAARKKSQGAN